MKDAREIILRPIVTEKTADAKEQSNIVCFEVARKANKIEVRRAVETLFGVKVVEVRVVNMGGKKRRAWLPVRRPSSSSTRCKG